MTNILKLHEAIAIVLLSKPSRTATFFELSEEIAKRQLYIRPKDGLPPPPYQIEMRTTLAEGRYKHLFEFIEPDIIRLRNYSLETNKNSTSK